jgi:hypothetical protein
VAVVGVLDVSEVGVDLDVLVGHVVAVEIAEDGEIGRVADPEIAAVPRHALNAVQAGGELPGGVGHAVAIRVDQDGDAIPRSLGRRVAVLRPVADKEPAAGVEGHRTRVAHQRLAGEELDFQLRRNRRQRTGRRRRGGRGADGPRRQQGESKQGGETGDFHERKTGKAARGPGRIQADKGRRVVSGAHQMTIMPSP